MKEKVILLTKEKLEKLNVFIDDVIYEKEGSENYLRIVLDSEDFIDLKKVVEATKIINPLLDEENLIEESYVLDVYAKSKGDE